MIVEIALGIVLALVIVVVCLAVLAAIIKWIPEILTFFGCIGSLLVLSHFLGGWGLALWFALIVGFICFADRDKIFEKSESKNPASKAD